MRFDLRLLVPLACAATFAVGCNLTTNYEETNASDASNKGRDGPATGCTPGETASCACLDAPSGVQTCKRDRTWGPCRCGDADGRESDAPEPDTGAGDGAPDTGLPTNTCPSDAETYRIRPARTTPNVDAQCADAEFGHAPEIPFPDDVDTTNNDASCRMVWDAESNRVHGCCTVQDDDFSADATPSDDPEAMWEPDGPGDDRLEYWVKCNLERQRDNCSYKTFINNLVNGGGDVGAPTFFSSVYDESIGDTDFSREADETAQVERRSGSWVLEWTAAIGFDPTASRTDHTGLCQFSILDVDDQSATGTVNSFGAHNSINRPDEWGCCFWEPTP